jgi:hypothetical protein
MRSFQSSFQHPKPPIFSLAPQMRMRYQAVNQRWRDDARKERDSVVFKCIRISDVNIE